MDVQSAMLPVVESGGRDHRGAASWLRETEMMSAVQTSREGKELTYGANELAFMLMVYYSTSVLWW